MKAISILFIVFLSFCESETHKKEKGWLKDERIILNKWSEPYREYDTTFWRTGCFNTENIILSYKIIDSADYCFQFIPQFSNDTGSICPSGWYVYANKESYDTLKVGDTVPYQFTAEYWDMNNRMVLIDSVLAN